MKKRGYTLAEVLTALAIVGVIAATMVPMVNKSKIDINKVRFLKVYDEIVSATQGLIYDEEYYPVIGTYNGNTVIYSQNPLGNINSSINIDGQSYGGIAKYCNLLRIALNGDGTCQDTDSKEISPGSNEDFAFETPNGTHFWVYTSIIPTDITKAFYRTNIFFDIDGNEGTNCSSRDANCIKPDRFALSVKADGKILANDFMAKEYLRTRSSYRLNKDVNEFVNEDLDEDFHYDLLQQQPECPDGQYWDGAKCVDEVQQQPECPDGQYWDGEKCVQLQGIPITQCQACLWEAQNPNAQYSPYVHSANCLLKIK